MDSIHVDGEQQVTRDRSGRVMKAKAIAAKFIIGNQISVPDLRSSVNPFTGHSLTSHKRKGNISS